MIIKKKLAKTLSDLDVLYNSSLLSANPNNAIFYSKLAVLEYCGWVEHSFDMIVNRCVKGKLNTQVCQNIMKGIIDNTHGFEYKSHFRSMMIKSIGIVGFEKFDSELNTMNYLPILVSELENAKVQRNSAAHTYSENLLITYSAPSVTIQSFNRIYPIVKHMYSYVCNKL